MILKIRRFLDAILGWLFEPVRGVFACFVPRAVVGADTTTLGQLLKQVYDPVIEDQTNTEAMTWREFPDGDDELGGQGWFFDTRMGGNQEGIGARAERGDLPSPGYQRHKQGIIQPKFCYGAFELTGPVIRTASSNLKAFAIARTDEIEGLTRDVIKDFNRQVFGDGRGILATIKARVSDTVFDVYDGLYLRLNMVVDVWDAGTPTTKNYTATKITGLAPQADGTMRVTMEAADTNDVAINDVVIREGNAIDAGGGVRASNEMSGLLTIIDDGTLAASFENISRSTFPLWKAVVLGNSAVNRNLTIDLLQQLEDAVYRNTGQRPDWMRMNLGQRRKFFDLVAPDRRYQGMSFDSGYERLSHNGNTITVDIDCPKNTIIAATRRTIRKYTMMKFGVIDFDGQVLRQVANKDVWRGYVGIYGNLGSKRPNANSKLVDLTEPSELQYVA